MDEGLHRYFTLEQLVLILCHLGAVGRGSDDMVEIIEKTLIKHRKGLTAETIEVAKNGFAQINKGSEIMMRVLEDPNTKLPALEWIKSSPNLKALPSLALWRRILTKEI